MDEEDVERVQAALGVAPTGWRVAPGHGAPSNRRYVIQLPDGRRAFAKIAAFDYTADWLRREYAAYRCFANEPFLPDLLGSHDDGEHPTLVIEDLSDARWPPPWSSELIDRVLTVLEVLRRHPAPQGAFEMAMWRAELTSWSSIAEDPSGVLGLGLCAHGRGSTVRLSRCRRPRVRRRSTEQRPCTWT
jgi:hypothetical protein